MFFSVSFPKPYSSLTPPHRPLRRLPPHHPLHRLLRRLPPHRPLRLLPPHHPLRCLLPRRPLRRLNFRPRHLLLATSTFSHLHRLLLLKPRPFSSSSSSYSSSSSFSSLWITITDLGSEDMTIVPLALKNERKHLRSDGRISGRLSGRNLITNAVAVECCFTKADTPTSSTDSKPGLSGVDLFALAMEEVAPLAISDAAMLAPEEIFHGKGNIKEEAELTKEERKRRRANQKRRFRRLKVAYSHLDCVLNLHPILKLSTNLSSINSHLLSPSPVHLLPHHRLSRNVDLFSSAPLHLAFGVRYLILFVAFHSFLELHQLISPCSSI
ncbi:hypothetical protein ZIOFF_015507 [Zingiber officinale]|uniref:Uncharacterized protein n=1 Tax=Zingiber officinale TaxID=94328 RepID=A0A8J5HIS2_ZINOF|nr:hypothetical protein ZIOFF_015507 [Zingiber officinale]